MATANSNEPTVELEYIGNKDFMLDNITGVRPPAVWNGKGSVATVSKSVADKLLIYADEFAVHDPVAKAAAEEAALQAQKDAAETAAIEAQQAADDAATALQEAEDTLAAYIAQKTNPDADQESIAAAKAAADAAAQKAEAASSKAASKKAGAKAAGKQG